MLLRSRAKNEDFLYKYNYLRSKGWKRYSIYKAWVDPITGDIWKLDTAYNIQTKREEQ